MLCVDLLPVVGRREGRLRARMRRQARRRHDGRPLLEKLGGEQRPPHRTDPVDVFDRRALGKGLEAKLREGATLFEAQVILRVRPPGGKAGRGV